MAVYHRIPDLIQLTSHPHRVYMPRDAGVSEWCFSHLPGANCFIQHYCANKQSKQVMSRKHVINDSNSNNDMFKVYTLKLDL